MQMWLFEAEQVNGDAARGTVEAESFDEACDLVRAMELTIVSVVNADGGTTRGQDGPWLGNEPLREPAGAHPGYPPRVLSEEDAKAAGRVSVPMIVFGGLFFGVGLLFNVIGLGLLFSGQIAGLFMQFTLIHTAIGFFVLRSALVRRRRRRGLSLSGQPATGRVTTLGWDRSLRVNGQNPYQMTYHFKVNEQNFEGKVTTMRRSIAVHDVDDAIWVLYDADNPDHSMEWPPL